MALGEHDPGRRRQQPRPGPAEAEVTRGDRSRNGHAHANRRVFAPDAIRDGAISCAEIGAKIRTESTPEIIAHHLSRDPNLSDAAAERIAALVRELYNSLAVPTREVQVRLRAAPTFKPEASRLLGELLGAMQVKLTADPHPGEAGR